MIGGMIIHLGFPMTIQPFDSVISIQHLTAETPLMGYIFSDNAGSRIHNLAVSINYMYTLLWSCGLTYQ